MFIISKKNLLPCSKVLFYLFWKKSLTAHHACLVASEIGACVVVNDALIIACWLYTQQDCACVVTSLCPAGETACGGMMVVVVRVSRRT